MRVDALLKIRLIGMVIAVVRIAERVMPPNLLAALLGVPSAFWSLLELMWLRPRVVEFGRLPVSWRPTGSPLRKFLTLWRQRTCMNVSKALTLIPDRLDAPRWRSRINVYGSADFERLHAEGRPIVLVTLHFGPVAVLFHWLRANRVPVAALVDRQTPSPRYRRRLNERVDRASHLQSVPRLILVDQVWDLGEFLRAGHVLAVAIDGDRGRSLIIEDSELALQMATGPLTLAGVTGATVVPCLIVARPGLRVEVHFGEPVPTSLTAGRAGHAEALHHILSAFHPIVRANPGQCSWELLRRVMTPKAVETVDPLAPAV